MMNHVTDTFSSSYIISFANQLLDSGLIKKEQVLKYKNGLITVANFHLAKLAKEEYPDGWYQCYGLMDMMKTLNTTETIGVIRKFLKQKNDDLVNTAAAHLLRMDQPVEPSVIQKLSADFRFRKSLYNTLVELNKTSLMPKQYLTQQLMTMSEVYDYASDDETEVTQITFVGEKTGSYKGSKKKFLLYKVEAKDYEGNKVAYLAVAGPHKSGEALALESEICEILWDEEFDAKNVEKQFKNFLKSLELVIKDEEVFEN